MNNREAFLDKSAAFISTLTSPFLVLAGFGLWAIGANSTSSTQFFLLGFLFILFIIGLPLLVIMLGIQRGTITDIHVAVREQRGLPFRAAIAGTFVVSVIFYSVAAPPTILYVAIALFINGLIFLVLTEKWKKVSIHAATFASASMIAAYTINELLLLLLLFVPVISLARIRRKRHTLVESLAAVLITLAATYTIFELAGLT
ncbi:MAG: phosphatase family protein [Patescibacteria group bacterium]|jgi:hypothetical protein|nr:phosphatase family protein [Patescibacteria group bacterium]